MSRPRRPYEGLIVEMRDQILTGPGTLDPAVRRAAFAGEAVPADVAAYVDKVRRHAYKVTDEDVVALRATRSDDELFELTVAVAAGAGLSRLDAVRRAMGDG